MTAHMMAGGPRHGEWFDVPGGAVRYFLLADPGVVGFDALDQVMASPETATLRSWYGRGWRIALRFWVPDSVSSQHPPKLPAGTVMPGWIEGVALERWPLSWRPR